MRGLDRKIDIERNSGSVLDSYGQPTEGWQKIVTRRAAWVNPVSGDERYQAAQFVARQQTEFRVRYSADVAEVTPLDRVIYPATNVTPEESDIYDIIAVNELGRREALQIIAARRSEAEAIV